MDYVISNADDGPVIKLTGRFTHADRQSFQQALFDLAGMAGRQLVIDLAALEFIDSGALGMLLLLREKADSAGKAVVLRRAMGQVQRLMGLTRFSEMFVIEE